MKAIVDTDTAGSDKGNSSSSTAVAKTPISLTDESADSEGDKDRVLEEDTLCETLPKEDISGFGNATAPTVEIQEATAQLEVEETGAPPPGYLWINQIEVLPEMQQRTCINPAVVNQYREMLDLSDPPPVTVYRVNGDRFILVDGFHRIYACIGERRELIPAIIFEGTWSEAVLASCTANAYNGQAMSSADKRRATETYLRTLEQLPEGDPRKKQSLREIAFATGASHATVKNIRSELEIAVKILQFKQGDRVFVICPENWRRLSSVETGTLGIVQDTDKKKGVYILTDNGQRCWVHPELVTHSSHPAPVKILQPANNSSNDGDSSESEKGTAHSSGVPHPTSVEDELNQKAVELGLRAKRDRVLPDVERTQPPAIVDDRPFASPTPPQKVEINTNDICIALISNVEYLSDEQILAVWKAISPRLRKMGVECEPQD